MTPDFENNDSVKPKNEYYVLRDDNDESQYILPDSEESDTENRNGDSNNGDDNNEAGFGKYWGIFFRILMSPVEGWKKLKRLHSTPEKVNSILLFPSLALVAIAGFISSLCWNLLTVQQALPKAIEAFCGFFFGYFCVLILVKLLLPKEGREAFDKPFGKNFVAVAMTSLAIFDVLIFALPMLQPVLVFLPLWTIFIICRGCRLLGVPEKIQIQTSTILSVLTIGVPWAISWLFSVIAPMNTL